MTLSVIHHESMKRVFIHSCRNYEDLKQLLNSDVNLALEFYEGRYRDYVLDNLFLNGKNKKPSDYFLVVIFFYPHLIKEIVPWSFLIEKNDDPSFRNFEIIMEDGMENIVTDNNNLYHIFYERRDLYEKFILHNLKNIADLRNFVTWSEESYFYREELLKDKEKFALTHNLSEKQLSEIIELHQKIEFGQAIDTPKKTIDEIKEIAESFVKKFGGTIMGSSALAFLTKKFIPNDVDVYYTNEDEYYNIGKDVDCEDVEFHSYEWSFKCGYANYKGFRFNLLLYHGDNETIESVISSFDIECCKVIWDPSLENPFSRTELTVLMAIKFNKVFCDVRTTTANRIIKYRMRGFNLYPI